MANFGDAATIPAITAPTTEKSPSSTTTATTAPTAHETTAACNAFCQFIEIADLKSIKKFLNTAASFPENENLEILWDRAYNEGYNEGRRALLRSLEKKLDDEYDKGYRIGVEESKVKHFKMGLEDGQMSERSEWIEDGHGQHCLMPVAALEEKGIQSNPATSISPLAPHDIVSPPETPEFTQKHPETRNSAVFPQKHPKTPVLTRFSWADDAEALPIMSTMPTKHPRDLSGLRSSSTNPFSSLRRRHRKQAQNPRNSYHFHHSQPRHTHYQHFNSFHSNPHTPHQFSQPSSFVSLNWDQDPRLFNLSIALKALGWIRR
ncbi:hypothetical protein BYT27DRAFT_7116220 [Phlegmacium glaucopus]|nr:hypothetical protein BYT27DRAFT_7116220 [Phlegmacium glaucopus]